MHTGFREMSSHDGNVVRNPFEHDEASTFIFVLGSVIRFLIVVL
jgi:hypothetical protein